MIEKHFKYSEIFGHTIQGEGFFTGRPTVWIRFWGCNFECSGFGQDNPMDKSSYVLDYQTIDASSIKRMEDLPVFSRGCDSSYSWAKKFSHLAHTGTAAEICDKLESFLKSPSNPEGKFQHPRTQQWTHMAFTGGEPMMNQTGIIAIMEEFDRRDNLPMYITIETNGTQEIRQNFESYFFSRYRGELFWSVSPKLYLSGERWEEAVQPNVLKQYYRISSAGQLKYVSNGTELAWKEVEMATDEYRFVGVDWDVWIMPVGADIEGQNKVAAMVTEEAVARGYNVAARVHTYIFGNVVGK